MAENDEGERYPEEEEEVDVSYLVTAHGEMPATRERLSASVGQVHLFLTFTVIDE